MIYLSQSNWIYPSICFESIQTWTPFNSQFKFSIETFFYTSELKCRMWCYLNIVFFLVKSALILEDSWTYVDFLDFPFVIVFVVVVLFFVSQMQQFVFKCGISSDQVFMLISGLLLNSNLFFFFLRGRVASSGQDSLVCTHLQVSRWV